MELLKQMYDNLEEASIGSKDSSGRPDPNLANISIIIEDKKRKIIKFNEKKVKRHKLDESEDTLGLIFLHLDFLLRACEKVDKQIVTLKSKVEELKKVFAKGIQASDYRILFEKISFEIFILLLHYLFDSTHCEVRTPSLKSKIVCLKTKMQTSDFSNTRLNCFFNLAERIGHKDLAERIGRRRSDILSLRDIEKTVIDLRDAIDVIEFYHLHIFESLRKGDPFEKPEKYIPYKTVMCFNWEGTGSCPYGLNCLYAHGIDELRDREDLYKTVMCIDWQKDGFCPRGPKCYYAHGINELRHRDF